MVVLKNNFYLPMLFVRHLVFTWNIQDSVQS